MIPLARLPDWAPRLQQTIEAASGRLFSWGEHDCCLFAADCIQAMTGADLMAEFRGQYDSAESAYRLIGRRGLASHLSQRLGDALPALFAHRGDLMTATGEDGRPAVGICVGEKALFLGPAGLLSLPISDCLSTWRVG